MRYVTFAPHGTSEPARLGTLADGEVIDLAGVEGLPSTMLGLLEAGPEAWEAAKRLLEAGGGQRWPQEVVRLHAPLPRPPSLRDFYAFERHVTTAFANRERQVPPEWYEFPVFYFSNPGSIVGPEDEVGAPPGSRALDYELEVACVIGRGGRDISAAEAVDHIFGFTIMNDWSARDLQQTEMRVGLGPAKGKDFATSLGPWLATPEELNPHDTGRPGAYDLAMTARVNGVERSRGNLSEMYYTFGDLIERGSRGADLYPGDVLGSGTVGSGCLLELSRGAGPWLQPGDVVELEVERLGVLRNRVTSHQ